MTGASKAVVSNQKGIHPRLDEIVSKHLAADFRKPYRAFSGEIFAGIEDVLARHGGPVIFDSGCGTGGGTLALAQRFPQSLVIGIDKSKTRVEKSGIVTGKLVNNFMIVQADLIDIWRLAAESGLRLQHHFLLYPNPWPKKQHFRRRWHGHPVFPTLLKLGGTLHLRSNWRIYMMEFVAALELATGNHHRFSTPTCHLAETAFEKKYLASGQTLFELVAEIHGRKSEINMTAAPIASD